MEKKIKIFDTTLRDGEQAPGCTMNLHEKLELALALEKLQVDVIEAGFPISSSRDFEAVKAISAVIKKSCVAALARATKGDVDSAYEALKEAALPRIHVFIATSELHMKAKLNMTRQEVLKAITQSVSYAKSLCEDVEFSAEDASRSDKDFLLLAFKAAVDAGATTVNIPDTVGYATPNEMAELVRFIKANLPKAVTISVHCHDDLGLGVACSLAAVNAGATQVECTVNGVGERAGNAALEEIVMGIHTRRDSYKANTNIITKQIYRTSKLLSTITGIAVPPNKAIVGANAFAHESGIHQHGVMQDRNTYEIMSPYEIGIPQNKMVLGKHSGKHALLERLEILGYFLSEADLEKAFVAFKALAEKKKIVTDKDIEALVSHNSDHRHQKSIEYVSFVINSGNTITSTANVKLSVEGDYVEKVATGDGPVDACFKAIDKIAKKNVTLENYTIQSVTEGMDALGEVVVKIKWENSIITGRGLSTDIIEASIKAYLNAVNKIR